jgi:geranylgeranylglyceryl phosphate synthase family protein
MGLYSEIQKAAGKGQKKFAVLIDPDKHTPASLKKIKTLSISGGADLFFFGGSLLTKDRVDELLDILKKDSPLPVLLFPGNNLQINSKADGILLLSLISGRNPELLIGRHVVAAPYIKASGLEVIPTGYILVDGGSATAVSYMSSTTPIPADKPGIAACTAMAGEMLGLGMIYMDAGSGAKNPVTVEMIREVRRSTSIPLVVGGGITTAVKARKAASAGADIVVVGNALEKDPGLVSKISKAIHQ